MNVPGWFWVLVAILIILAIPALNSALVLLLPLTPFAGRAARLGVARG